MLLSNGNQYASVTTGHSVFLKESYQTMDFVLMKIKYCTQTQLDDMRRFKGDLRSTWATKWIY